MSTKVTITVHKEDGPWDARTVHDGPWDARVREVSTSGGEASPTRVKQGESADFYIHSGQGLRIDEVDAEESPVDDAEEETEESPPDDAEDEETFEKGSGEGQGSGASGWALNG